MHGGARHKRAHLVIDNLPEGETELKDSNVGVTQVQKVPEDGSEQATGAWLR